MAIFNPQARLPIEEWESPVRVSLDLESVLADVHPYFLSVYNAENNTSYERDDIDNWDWVREEVDFEEFNKIVDLGWRETSSEIQPTEGLLDETVEKIGDHPAFTVDIVTARTGVEEHMKNWLSENGITAFDQFRSTTKSKAELGYDVYIDDKPGLADEIDPSQVQYLVYRPHNSSAVDHEKTVPAAAVQSAVMHLIGEYEATVDGCETHQ